MINCILIGLTSHITFEFKGHNGKTVKEDNAILTELIIPIILLGIVSLLMHAANSVITSMAPLYMRDKMDSGLLAGVLNGSCYVGSTISSYGLGVIADNSGWNAVFYLLFGLCLIPAIIAFVISVVNIIKSKKNKSIAN